jgi:uncharacterized protein (UPF0332 family)
MKLNDLLSRRLVERVEADLGKVIKSLTRAKRDLMTARATLEIDEEWAYTIAYHAMLRAGRALMLYHQYRPAGKDQHNTVGEFCSRVLGEEYRTLVNKFQRMRRKRHKFIYEIEGVISKTEAKESIDSAKKLIEGINETVKGKRGDLFDLSQKKPG